MTEQSSFEYFFFEIVSNIRTWNIHNIWNFFAIQNIFHMKMWCFCSYLQMSLWLGQHSELVQENFQILKKTKTTTFGNFFGWISNVVQGVKTTFEAWNKNITFSYENHLEFLMVFLKLFRESHLEIIDQIIKTCMPQSLMPQPTFIYFT